MEGLDRVVGLVAEIRHEFPSDHPKAGDDAVVHPEVAPVRERVAVLLVDGHPGHRGAHVREHQRGRDLARQAAEVLVVPRGRDRGEDAGGGVGPRGVGGVPGGVRRRSCCCS